MSLARRFAYFFAPSVVQGAASFLMLPAITYVIGPAEYGAFALVTALTAVGSSVAGMGSGYLLATHYPGAGQEERRRMISTLLVAGLVVLLLYVPIVVAGWSAAVGRSDALAGIPRMGVALAMAGMVATLPWMLAQEVIAVEGEPRAFAATTTAQTIVWVVATLLGLYVLRWGLLALFAGAFAGSLVGGLGGVYSLRAYLRPLFDATWMRRMLPAGSLGSIGGLLESLQTVLERHLLALHVGLAPVGLYTHSQQYRGMAMWGVKAASRTAWGPTLEDARDPAGDFARTRRVWDPVFVGLTLLGLVFATLGGEIVGLLTHDRFTGAYPLVALWMVYLLLISTGKPQTGILYAAGRWKSYLAASLVGSVAGSVALFFLIPWAGIYGAAAALIGQQVILRVLLQAQARRSRRGYFQDEWALIGSALIVLALGSSRMLGLGTGANAVLLLVMVGVVGFGAREVFQRAWFTVVGEPRPGRTAASES